MFYAWGREFLKRGEKKRKRGRFHPEKVQKHGEFHKMSPQEDGKTNQSHASSTHAAYIVINRSKDQLLPPEPAYLLKGGISEH